RPKYNAPSVRPAAGSNSDGDSAAEAAHQQTKRLRAGAHATGKRRDRQTMLRFWQDCSRLLESELTPQQFAAWIKPLKAINFDDETGDLRLGAPNRLKLDAVRAQFSSRIQAAVVSVLRRPVNVVFEVEADARDEAPAQESPAREASPHDGSAVDLPELCVPVVAASQNQERARLNPLLTFDNFVTGKANQLARAAAMQVTENPGGSYNPLILYGGVGLGKTHLVHAVGNHALRQNPNCHVVYLSSESFTNDLIHALEQHRMPEFRARYREKCDILLLDDIQFLSNKKQT